MGMRAMGREQGQVTPLIVAVLALAALVLFGVARLGVAASEGARARTAADAAALAGAADGRVASERLAADNGGRIDAYTEVGLDVIVTVEVGGARATARARAGPAAVPGS